MTSQAIRDPLADHLITPQNAALVLIDYQPSQFATVRSMDEALLRKNIVSTVRAARAFGLPIVTFEQKLDPHKFVKLHRSCIVNLDFVESLTPDENSQLVARMTDGTLITANRDVSKKLREQSI